MSVITSNRPRPKINILDKRVPQNPKYKDIQPMIDTGDSFTNFLKRNEEGSIKQQTGELFKRMKISTLVKLIIQVAEINSLENPRNAEYDSSTSQRTLNERDRPETQDSQMSIDTTRSTLQSVIRGVGEMDVYNNYKNHYSTKSATPKTANSEQLDLEYDETPYLIVDLRDIDEFNTNHIVSAHHYPATMLSRCSNNESRELLIYKNKKGKIIVLYDEDERLALRSATIMTERGYNNIFVLTGGLKYAVQKFPCGLITGRCPLSWTLSNTPAKQVKLHNCSQSVDASRNEIPLNQSVANTIRRSPGAMAIFDTREQFTTQDIEDLNAQHEANILPRDSGTRLSHTQTQSSKQSSRSSNVSDRSNLSNISDKHWKP